MKKDYTIKSYNSNFDVYIDDNCYSICFDGQKNLFTEKEWRDYFNEFFYPVNINLKNKKSLIDDLIFELKIKCYLKQ